MHFMYKEWGRRKVGVLGVGFWRRIICMYWRLDFIRKEWTFVCHQHNVQVGQSNRWSNPFYSILDRIGWIHHLIKWIWTYLLGVQLKARCTPRRHGICVIAALRWKCVQLCDCHTFASSLPQPFHWANMWRSLETVLQVWCTVLPNGFRLYVNRPIDLHLGSGKKRTRP